MYYVPAKKQLFGEDLSWERQSQSVRAIPSREPRGSKPYDAQVRTLNLHLLLFLSLICAFCEHIGERLSVQPFLPPHSTSAKSLLEAKNARERLDEMLLNRPEVGP
jgi:hypothetical protein